MRILVCKETLKYTWKSTQALGISDYEWVSECLAQETKTGETKATHNLPGLGNAVYLICLNDWRTESFSFLLLLSSCVTV